MTVQDYLFFKHLVGMSQPTKNKILISATVGFTLSLSNVQGNGVSSPLSLAMFEDQLRSLKVPVEFTTDKAFIPSFLEDWVFYQVSLKQGD